MTISDVEPVYASASIFFRHLLEIIRAEKLSFYDAKYFEFFINKICSIHI